MTYPESLILNDWRASFVTVAGVLLTLTSVGGAYAQPQVINSTPQGAPETRKPHENQADTDPVGVADPSARPSKGTKNDAAESPEIVVTGSHIRGAAPTGSPVNVIDRSEIERSGLGTAAQVLHALPQNFRGGINEEVREGPDYGTNAFGGSTINLRGLGANSTLVLLNGRRVPGGGLKGGFTDISLIPLSAIERIEVLPDGASAVYGSDAVAGVVNIVLKKNYEEIESRARYGSVTKGSLDDYQLSQSFGYDWGSGGILGNYEYHNRDALPASEVSRARTADMRRFGGDDHRFIYSNPGNILDPNSFLPAYAIPANQNGRSLTVNDLFAGKVNLGEPNFGSDLSAGQERHSVYMRIRQGLSADLDVSAEGLYSTRNFSSRHAPDVTTLTVLPSNPYFIDPFGLGYTLVSYNFYNEQAPRNSGRVTDALGMLTADYQIKLWEVRATAAYGLEKSRVTNYEVIDYEKLSVALENPDPRLAFNPFADGPGLSPGAMRQLLYNQFTKRKSQIWNANLTTDGPLADLPAGQIKLAAGADFRREKLRGLSESNTSISAVNIARNIYASFGEISVPLIAEAMNIPLIRTLDISLALRYDKYEHIGDTVNPKVGARMEVAEGLELRSSYGTSFRAPSLLDIDNSAPTIAVIMFPDPRSASGISQVLYLAGSNPDLNNEKSTTWTVGFDWRPLHSGRLAFNLTYFDILFKDRISSPAVSTALLGQEDRYPNAIVRNPTASELGLFCSHPRLIGNRSECREGRIAAILDLRLQNMSRTNVRGLDIGVSSNFPAFGGDLGVGLNASYIIDYRQQEAEGASTFELVNTLGNPVDLRLRGNAVWVWKGLSASAFINYQDSYVNDRKIPFERIDSWLTIDVQFAYRLGVSQAGIFNNTSLSLSVQNIFNAKPPFVNWEIGYDPANASALGRFVALEFRKQW